MNGFAEVLDSAEKLTLDEQEQLAETLRRRIAENRREELISAVQDSRAEFGAGRAEAATASEIISSLVK